MLFYAPRELLTRPCGTASGFPRRSRIGGADAATRLVGILHDDRDGVGPRRRSRRLSNYGRPPRRPIPPRKGHNFRSMLSSSRTLSGRGTRISLAWSRAQLTSSLLQLLGDPDSDSGLSQLSCAFRSQPAPRYCLSVQVWSPLPRCRWKARQFCPPRRAARLRAAEAVREALPIRLLASLAPAEHCFRRRFGPGALLRPTGAF